MEVLISVFILSVGLMGLLALIPIGTVDVLEAVKADRGASAGRAVNHEIKVRRMCDPGMWMNHMQSDDPVKTGNASITQAWWDIDDLTEPNPDWPTDEGHSICIDPLFIARTHQAYLAAGNNAGLPPVYDGTSAYDPDNANNWTKNQPAWPGRAFPYYLDNDPGGAIGWPTNTDPPAPPRMTRVSVRAWPSLLAPMMSYGLADRVFSWQDDLVFNLPPDATLRPEAQIDDVGRTQNLGNYTWMATLSPADGQSEVPTLERRLYNYSVVVFYKRNLNQPVPIDRTIDLDGTNRIAWKLSNRSAGPPSERVVFADLLTPGVSFGGGDVRLRLVLKPNDALVTNVDSNTPDLSDFTKIRPGNWILLSGYLQKPTNPAPTDPDWHRTTFQWYRVIAAGDGPELMDGSAQQPTASGQREWVRDVTLAGPDWNPGPFQDADGKPAYGTLYATLVEGVVAVFTRTIELDTWSDW